MVELCKKHDSANLSKPADPKKKFSEFEKTFRAFLYEESIHLYINVLDILFLSNHNIYKNSSDYRFWTSDPLDDIF